jgi:hypothetical protein
LLALSNNLKDGRGRLKDDFFEDCNCKAKIFEGSWKALISLRRATNKTSRRIWNEENILNNDLE